MFTTGIALKLDNVKCKSAVWIMKTLVLAENISKLVLSFHMYGESNNINYVLF